jgi:SPP1 gp7 family putative phage head morphogenesis protein
MNDWDAFMAKSVEEPGMYAALGYREKLTAFTVTCDATFEQLEGVRDALGAIYRRGGTFADFKKAVAGGDYGGVCDLPEYRLENVFRTNVKGAYGRGRYMEQREMRDVFPYLKYVAVDDSQTRPTHAALNGLIVRAGSPEADRIYPPNGYQCRCAMRGLTAAQAKRMGGPTPMDELRKRIAENPPDGGWDGPPFEGGADALTSLPEMPDGEPKHVGVGKETVSDAEYGAALDDLQGKAAGEADAEAEAEAAAKARAEADAYWKEMAEALEKVAADLDAEDRDKDLAEAKEAEKKAEAEAKAKAEAEAKAREAAKKAAAQTALAAKALKSKVPASATKGTKKAAKKVKQYDLTKIDPENPKMQKFELKKREEIRRDMLAQFKAAGILGENATYADYEAHLERMMREIYKDAGLDADRYLRDSQSWITVFDTLEHRADRDASALLSADTMKFLSLRERQALNFHTCKGDKYALQVFVKEKGKVPREKVERMEDYFRAQSVIGEVLNKHVKRPERELHRGAENYRDDTDTVDLISFIKSGEGKTMRMRLNLSFSEDETVPQDFIVGKTATVIFHIVTDKGIPIKTVSAFKLEDEQLLLNGQVYKIGKAVQMPGNGNHWEVTITLLGPDAKPDMVFVI